MVTQVFGLLPHIEPGLGSEPRAGTLAMSRAFPDLERDSGWERNQGRSISVMINGDIVSTTIAPSRTLSACFYYPQRSFLLPADERC